MAGVWTHCLLNIYMAFTSSFLRPTCIKGNIQEKASSWIPLRREGSGRLAGLIQMLVHWTAGAMGSQTRLGREAEKAENQWQTCLLWKEVKFMGDELLEQQA